MNITPFTIDPNLTVDDSVLLHSVGLPGAIMETSEKIEDIAMQQLNQIRTVTLDDGSTYTGEFQNGLPNGRGTLYYQEGNLLKKIRYEGQFKNGLLHGKGILHRRNANNDQVFDVSNGRFEKGHFIEGTLTYGDGGSFKGTFYDDEHFETGEFDRTDLFGQRVITNYKDRRDRGVLDPITGKYSNECCGVVCVIL